MRNKRSNGGTGVADLRLGEPFNPYGLFHGIWIAEALLREKEVSCGAKLVYGRLARFAGQDGDCHPSVPTLAIEIGMSVRQTQNYLAELVRKKLIRRIPRISEAGQTSNAFVFLWHALFEKGVTKRSPDGVKDPAPEGVKDPAHKESPLEESQVKERNIDLDSPPSNRKKRDSRADAGDAAAKCNPHPRLRETLADYMITPDDPERIYPTDRLVVDVMAAANGASEDEVIECLRYLRNERGLRPGTKQGPHKFAWFKTVVGDYFNQKSSREMMYAPARAPGATNALDKDEFDSMTDAIEI